MRRGEVIPKHKTRCPACGLVVDRVDREYARHRLRGALCAATRREIEEFEKAMKRTGRR